MRRRRRHVHASTNLCTASPDRRGICLGDAGSPLINEDGVLIGIASWSYECARTYPDVYTNVFQQMRYIVSITKIRV